MSFFGRDNVKKHINMKNEQVYQITERICKVKLANGPYPDGYIDDHPIYLTLFKHITENNGWGSYFASEEFTSPHSCFFVTAIKIIAASFAMHDAYFSLRADIVESDIERNLENLNLKELAEVFSFWVSRETWTPHEDTELEEDFIATDEEEKIRAETATDMLKTVVLLRIDNYIESLKSFLNYQTERSFFYKLLDSDSEDTESRICSILR